MCQLVQETEARHGHENVRTEIARDAARAVCQALHGALGALDPDYAREHAPVVAAAYAIVL